MFVKDLESLGTVCQKSGESWDCLSKIWRVMGLFVKNLESHGTVCQRSGESLACLSKNG